MKQKQLTANSNSVKVDEVKLDTSKFTSFDDYLKEQLRDPEFKKEWANLDPWAETVKALIELRKKEALTQKQLADKLRTTQSAISRLESGNYNPSFRFLERLARSLGKRLEIRFVPT